MECLASLTELRRCTQTGRAVDVRTSIRPIPWWLPELTGQKNRAGNKKKRDLTESASFARFPSPSVDFRHRLVKFLEKWWHDGCMASARISRHNKILKQIDSLVVGAFFFLSTPLSIFGDRQQKSFLQTSHSQPMDFLKVAARPLRQTQLR